MKCPKCKENMTKRLVPNTNNTYHYTCPKCKKVVGIVNLNTDNNTLEKKEE